MPLSVLSGAAPMEGTGAYNRNSLVQQTGAEPGIPLLERAAMLVDLPPATEPVVIADYGSSQGHSSLGPMGTAIRVLRSRIGAERGISVVHTDLPASDFSALFQLLATDAESYLKRDPAAFASAVGRSFYEQILPSGSVTLGWSSWAVQWLSRAPAPIPDQVQVAFSADAAIRELYTRQARDDWHLFLRQRSRELRQGGRLVVLTMALTDAGDFGYRPLLDALYGALRGLVGERFLTGEELHRMAIPTVGRSHADLVEPFGAGRLEDLELEHAEVFLGENPIWRDYEHDRDARAYGARWAAFTRSSVLPTLATALDDSARTAEFLDLAEAGMAERLSAHTEEFPIPLGLVAVRKV